MKHWTLIKLLYPCLLKHKVGNLLSNAQCHCFDRGMLARCGCQKERYHWTPKFLWSWLTLYIGTTCMAGQELCGVSFQSCAQAMSGEYDSCAWWRNQTWAPGCGGSICSILQGCWPAHPHRFPWFLTRNCIFPQGFSKGSCPLLGPPTYLWQRNSLLWFLLFATINFTDITPELDLLQWRIMKY